jgi:hypothetical protein
VVRVLDSEPEGPCFDGLITRWQSWRALHIESRKMKCLNSALNRPRSAVLSPVLIVLRMTKNVQFRTFCWVNKKQCFVLVDLNINTCHKSLLMFRLTHIYRCITTRAVTGNTCVYTKHLELHQTRAVTSQHVSLRNKDPLSTERTYKSVELFTEGGGND